MGPVDEGGLMTAPAWFGRGMTDEEKGRARWDTKMRATSNPSMSERVRMQDGFLLVDVLWRCWRYW